MGFCEENATFTMDRISKLTKYQKQEAQNIIV